MLEGNRDESPGGSENDYLSEDATFASGGSRAKTFGYRKSSLLPTQGNLTIRDMEEKRSVPCPHCEAPATYLGRPGGSVDWFKCYYCDEAFSSLPVGSGHTNPLSP